MATVDPTTNYSWNLPDVNGDDGSWGAALNAILGDDATGIDAVLKAVSDVADAALPVAGGSMTGELDVLTERFVTNNLGNMTGTATMDLDVANFFYGTVTGDVTISFSNVPASPDGVFVTLELTNPGAHTITWPGAATWPNGAPPAFTASGVDVITAYTRDGGTTWRFARAMEDIS